MNKLYASLTILSFSFFICTFSSCGGSDKAKEEKTPETKETKKDTPVAETPKTETAAPRRAPIINIMDTVSVRRTVICLKDSAATFDRIALKLGEIYGFKLAAILKKTGMKAAGQPMAWYNTTKAPYYFEAGIPVEKKMGKIPSNVIIKQTGGDSVTIARFYGPYDLLPQAYDALRDVMKDRKKKAKEKMYEIYIDDPMDKEGKMKDPYKVQTDVIFTW